MNLQIKVGNKFKLCDKEEKEKFEAFVSKFYENAWTVPEQPNATNS